MSIISGSDAIRASNSRNLTLPSHYVNCSLKQLSLNCRNSVYPGFVVAIEMTTTDTELRSAWTCDEVADYSTQFESFQSTLNGMYWVNSLGVYDPSSKPSTTFQRTLGGKVLAPIGFVLNILLFVTLCSPRLNGRVFWYLRFIAFAQICQAIVKITNDRDIGLSDINFITAPSNKGFIYVILHGMTNIFPFFKQFAIAMGLFVSLERFASVFASIKYNNERVQKRYFLAAIGCSIVIGTLTLFSMYLILYHDDTRGKWVSDQGTRWETIRTWIYNYITAYFVVIFDIGSIILALIFTVCINVQLMRRSRKIVGMMSTASAKGEHKKIMYYSRLQTLDTIALIIDLCSTLFDQLRMVIQKNIVNCTSRDCLFPGVIGRYLVASQVSSQASYVFEIVNGFCHAELFILYLIFSKQFREAFVTVWGDAYRKLRSFRCN